MKRNTSAGFSSFSGASLQLFSASDLHQLHLGTLEILELTGIRVGSDQALDYFEKAGAQVERSAKTVRIPAYMVEEAIKSAPASVFLAGKDPKYDIILEDGRVHYCPFGVGITMVDKDTGELRDTTKQDVADCTRLVDYLDEYDFCFDPVVARDVPEPTACIHASEAILLNTKKPCLASPIDTRTAEIMYEMAAVAAGGEENLRRRPIVMNGVCTISPLTIPDDVCDSIIATAKNRLPLMVLSMAMSGGMGPVTLAGALTVMNAEIMGALVLSQLVNKGTPFVYGTSTGTLDMRHNASAMVGCPELGLISSGVAALCRQLYQIPSLVAGG